MHNIINWLEAHELSCFFIKTFGIECPGCGTQRAFIFLLKGDLVRSFQIYPPLLPLLSLMLFLALHLIFKFKNGGVLLKYVFLVTAFSVLLNFIYRLIVQV